MWNVLAGEDAAKASEAVWGMAAAPTMVLPDPRHAKSPATVDEQSVAKLLLLLDDDNFDVAAKKRCYDLIELGKAVGPFLKQRRKRRTCRRR